MSVGRGMAVERGSRQLDVDVKVNGPNGRKGACEAQRSAGVPACIAPCEGPAQRSRQEMCSRGRLVVVAGSGRQQWLGRGRPGMVGWEMA